MYESVPEELKRYPNWVCFRFEKDKKHPEKPKKVPVTPDTGYWASSTDPATWRTYEEAVKASSRFNGIGFMFGNSPYFGVDLDKKENELRDYISGDNNNIIGEFVDALKSYTELSPSGKGIHIICKGSLPKDGRKNKELGLEMYDTARFFTVTGNRFGEYTEIRENTETIKPLHAKYFSKKDEQKPVNTAVSSALPTTAAEVVELASGAKNGSKFVQLYKGDITGYNQDSSAADMAFCNMLAFWTGRNAALMDAIFRASGLMREKWDEKHYANGATYGAATIQKAVAECAEVYTPTAVPAVNVTIGGGNKWLYSLDDMGNSARFIDLFHEDARYNYTAKKWLIWDGKRWKLDENGEAERLADRSIEAMVAELSAYDDEDAQKAFKKHIKSSRSRKSKENMLKESQHLVPIMTNELDKHPFALNTPDGIIALRTGEVYPHDRKWRITKITGVAPAPDIPPSSVWIGFMDRIFNGDKDVIRYIQKAAGYSLTGSIAEQCIFILIGNGNNGKSTFLKALRQTFGDYCMNMQAESITMKTWGGAGSDIARLNKARFVTVSEPQEGMRLNESLIKQLTGGEPVTARKLYENECEFHPELKLWIGTNHKLIIRGTDDGIWRRMRVIPMAGGIPPNEVDINFPEKLKAERPIILRWVLDGCRMWLEEGLKPPAAVLRAVTEYRREMDVVSTFVNDRCEVKDGAYIRASDLYTAYVQWCGGNNEYLMSNTKFGAEITKKFRKEKRADANYFIGLQLLI